MKKILTLTILLFAYHLAFSQQNTLSRWRDYSARKAIDSCTLAVTYNYKYVVDTLKNTSLFEPMVLEVGSNFSHYYSPNSYERDSIHLENRKANPSAGAYPTIGWKSSEESTLYTEIYTNYAENNRIEVARFNSTEYHYNEPIETLQWTICEGDTTILGYQCNFAEVEFRGRKYKAYFTLEIPTSSSPWKLGGLPGLILKAEDSEGLFSWTAIGVEQPKNRAIYRYEGNPSKDKLKRVKRKDLAALWQRFWVNPMSIYRLENPNVNFMTYDQVTGETAELKVDMSLPDKYYPQLELE